MPDSPTPQTEPSSGENHPSSPAAPGSDAGSAAPASHGPPAPLPRSRKGWATGPLVLAGLGFAILAFLGVVGSAGPARLLFWVATVLEITALALGVLGARRVKQGYGNTRGRYLTGAVLGGLATVWCINGAVAATDPFQQVSCQDKQSHTKSQDDPSHTTSSSGAKAGSPTSSTVSFRTTWCFKNGVQATVSTPKPYTPRAMNDGSDTQEHRAVAVQVTIRNVSTNIVDLGEFLSLGAKDADGRMAGPIFQGGDHSRGVGKTLLLPGMEKEMTQGFSLPSSAAKSMSVEASLSLAADRKSMWTGPSESAWWSGRVR
ncbi:hypothetical protein [Streptomyces kronopolitis]|uniref:hypothetical protein n=1 Tax=Streptomyces kronopolitis TaxID=1612435 RepID=UPI003D996D0D